MIQDQDQTVILMGSGSNDDPNRIMIPPGSQDQYLYIGTDPVILEPNPTGDPE